jgi:hypothetical protein
MTGCSGVKMRGGVIVKCGTFPFGRACKSDGRSKSLRELNDGRVVSISSSGSREIPEVPVEEGLGRNIVNFDPFLTRKAAAVIVCLPPGADSLTSGYPPTSRREAPDGGLHVCSTARCASQR